MRAAAPCRVLEQDAGPLGAARRLREAAKPHLIAVQPLQGRELMLLMALRCYGEAQRAAPSAALAYEQAPSPCPTARGGQC